MGVNEAHKRKSEIEAAVIKVFGQRYSTTNYWLLSVLQDRAQQLKNEINNPAAAEAATITETTAANNNTLNEGGDDLPF